MYLLEWIQGTNQSIRKCALAWGFSYPTLHNIANRKARASWDHGAVIEANTGGAVTMAEVCGPQALLTTPKPKPVLPPVAQRVVPRPRRSVAAPKPARVPPPPPAITAPPVTAKVTKRQRAPRKVA